MKWFWAWVDRVRPRAEVTVTVPARLLLDPNPMVRQVAVLERLKDYQKDGLLDALELLHEYYLAQMAEGIGPRMEGEPEAYFRPEEAPLIVVRDMVGLVIDLSGRQQIIKARMGERKVS